jgi:diguanylate cyclase (GGDEF)-like protein
MSQIFSESILRSLPGGLSRQDQPLPMAGNAALSPAELSFELQVTLNPEAVLGRFSRVIQLAFPHDGFTYEHAGAKLQISQGRVSRHSCTYNLSLKGEDLGDLRFLRGRKFLEPELAHLETLLTGLLYPLRNALLYQQAVQASQTDPLTGVHNRKALDQLLTRELASFDRGGEPVALLVLDLDHFKRVNDTLGHTVGDRVLKAVTGCLLEATRASDMVFRSGGEEFVVLMRVATPKDAIRAAERIRSAVETCTAVQDAAPGQHVTASIGIALARWRDTAVTLFDRADKAMYEVKRSGRNRVNVAD